MVKNNSDEVIVEKPYTEDAKAFLKILDKFVILKQTNPSPYNDILEATRKFLETFKKMKVK